MKTAPELLQDSRRVKAEGNQYLTMGASVGAIGLAGAALGAVCPLCVVATPALLSFGLVQRLRAHLLSRKASVPLEPATGELK